MLRIIRPDIFTNFIEYGNRYCDPKPSIKGIGMEYKGSSNPRELHYILSKTIMIRRLKNNVISQLPEKKRHKVLIEADTQKISKINELLDLSNGNVIKEAMSELVERKINVESDVVRDQKT